MVGDIGVWTTSSCRSLVPSGSTRIGTHTYCFHITIDSTEKHSLFLLVVLLLFLSGDWQPGHPISGYPSLFLAALTAAPADIICPPWPTALDTVSYNPLLHASAGELSVFKRKHIISRITGCHLYKCIMIKRNLVESFVLLIYAFSKLTFLCQNVVLPQQRNIIKS